MVACCRLAGTGHDRAVRAAGGVNGSAWTWHGSGADCGGRGHMMEVVGGIGCAECGGGWHQWGARGKQDLESIGGKHDGSSSWGCNQQQRGRQGCRCVDFLTSQVHIVYCDFEFIPAHRAGQGISDSSECVPGQ
jgi:hypothetical protein